MGRAAAEEAHRRLASSFRGRVNGESRAAKSGRWFSRVLSPLYAASLALASMLLTASTASAELCVFDLDPPAPYHVLGSLVIPQSSSLFSDDCDKTVDQVRADIAAERTRVAEAEAAAQAPDRSHESTSNADLELWLAAHLVARGDIRAPQGLYHCRVTKADFNKLHPGMRYDAAVSVLGCPGFEASRTALNGVAPAIIYTWKGGSGLGADVTATFQDDRLMSKGELRSR